MQEKMKKKKKLLKINKHRRAKEEKALKQAEKNEEKN